jgi:colanic acid biosynthesis glycosyl transferase WcaI
VAEHQGAGKRMKILIISQYFWPENFRINELALGLIKRGHQVTVLTGIPNYPGGKFFNGYGIFRNTSENYKGIKIKRVPMVPRGKGGTIRLALAYFSFTISMAIFSIFLSGDGFDMILFSLSPIAEGIPAVILKNIKKTPLVMWVQDLWPESLSATGAVKNRHILNGTKSIMKFVYQQCDHVFVQSERFAANIQAMGVDNGRISYFPNWNAQEDGDAGIDRNGIKECGEKLSSGFCILYAGNIGAAQDFNTTLSAMEKLKAYSDINLCIFGEGRYSLWVKEEVGNRGLGQNVHLMGHHPSAEMPFYFSQASALLVTLKTEPTFALTIPTKVQAYLAQGRPIIAALEGEGARIINESGAGVTCASSSADALANAILSLYRRPYEDRQRMGLNGLEYYKVHFDYETLMNKFEKRMLKLCSGVEICA